MSKKLLEEQAVRKFMKIAGLQPLTNSFLKESEEQKDLEEAKKDVKEVYGKKKVEESSDSEGERLEEEVEDLEEGKEELEEGGGQMPFDAQDRRADERAPEGVNEAKALVGKVKTKGGAKMSPASKSSKNGSSGKGLVKEEDMPEEGSEDVEAPEMDAAPEGDMGAGGLDVEGLVKELIRVITEKVPGAADVISVEDEGEETEVEMEPEMEPEMDSEDEEGALDEAALEAIVAETVKRVKGRLMESKKPALTKQDLVKKVAAKVAEKLKKA
jgi:hypothetical protein